MLRDLINATLAFGRGMWEPIITLAFHCEARWNRRKNPGLLPKLRPGHLRMDAGSRGTLQRSTNRENIQTHAPLPVGPLA